MLQYGTALSWGELQAIQTAITVSYDVYFGTDPDPRTKVSDGSSSTTFNPILLKGYTYYWKVVAKDDIGGTQRK